MCGHGERAMGAASLLARAGHPDLVRAGRRTRRLGQRHRPIPRGGRVSRPDAKEPDNQPTLGLRANAAQFTLLVAVNALVGGMVGQEQHRAAAARPNASSG